MLRTCFSGRLVRASALLCSLLPGIGAAEVTLQPRVTVGAQDYEFNYFDVIAPVLPLRALTRDGFKVGDRLQLHGVGLTVASGRWFFDIGGQRTDTGTQDTLQFIGADIVNFALLPRDIQLLLQSLNVTNGPGATHDLRTDFSREDLNGVIGFGVNSNLSIFVGYKDAKTKLRNLLAPRFVPTLSVFQNVAFGNLYLIGEQRNEFSYKGEFIGASYSAPVERWRGAFGIQASVARLTGKIDTTYDGAVLIAVPIGTGLAQIPPSAAGLDTTIEAGRGKSTGLNLGLSWTGNLGGLSARLERLSYTIGVDRSEYTFKSSIRGANDFSETVTRARLDLKYAFTVGKKAE